MTAPVFVLTVVTSADGFIARRAGEPPQLWASPEEQALFYADIEAADWAIMGRRTHEDADRAERRRIIFSSGAPGWRRKTQLWLDPKGLAAGDLAALVEGVRPLRRGVILGGTRVHDWFLAQGGIHEVHLTIEPVRFGVGLPVFSGQEGDPERVMEGAGFGRVSDGRLNAGGTRYQVWRPGG